MKVGMIIEVSCAHQGCIWWKYSKTVILRIYLNICMYKCNLFLWWHSWIFSSH